MNSVSDEEVSFAIRYLDPDLHEVDEVHQTNLPSWRWVKPVFVILPIAGILYFTALRYLPAVVRLLN